MSEHITTDPSITQVEAVASPNRLRYGRKALSAALALTAALTLSACGESSPSSAEHSAASSSATAAPEATTPHNDLTDAEGTKWGELCGFGQEQFGELNLLTQANVNYFRKAFANQAALNLGYQDVCSDLLDDLGNAAAANK